MAIELRFEDGDVEEIIKGQIVVACCICKEPISDPNKGTAVWEYAVDDPGDDDYLCLDYAHLECEGRLREKAPFNVKVGDLPIDFPLPKLLDVFKELMDPKTGTGQRWE